MKIIDLPQGTPEWREWRLDGVGASEVPSLLGISPYADASREDVKREKVTRVPREETYAMRRGKLLEPAARLAYQQGRPCEVRVCCVQHDDYPWALASLDGLCQDRHGEWWVLELKCQKQEVHAQVLAGIVPYWHMPQVQWQLFCTGLTRCDYASFSKAKRFAPHERLKIITVERDDALIARLLDEAADFWLEVMDARERMEVGA